MASAMSAATAIATDTATDTAAATAMVCSLIMASSGLAPRSLRFVFLFCYQTILSSHRSRYRLLPPPLLLRPQTKRLPADETPPRDHKGLFPFFTSTNNLSRRSRSRLLLFHFSPQTKPCPAIIKVCFLFLIWNDILSRRSRCRLLLFYSRPQTTPPRDH